MNLSREFNKMLSSMTASSQPKSRLDQDSAFSEESLVDLKENISSPSVSTATMKENMVQLIYGEMMGRDVSFGAIHALKLAQSGQSVSQKRAGYLACSLLLHDGDELNIMLVNTLQKDLSSSNFHHVVTALVTLCNMTSVDVIPSMVSPVLAVLSHSQESVRKRAIVVLKRFYRAMPEVVLVYLPRIKQVLYDADPGVVSAALGLLTDVAKDDPQQVKDLIPVLIKILQQVIESRLPRGYEYHGFPAPWIQIRCLQLMAVLGQSDLDASQAMTPILMAAFGRASQGVDAAFGVLYELIKTINAFHPSIIVGLAQNTASAVSHHQRHKKHHRRNDNNNNITISSSPSLSDLPSPGATNAGVGGVGISDMVELEDAIKINPLLIIQKFATSSNHNLKYLGISMLCLVRPEAWSDTWWNADLMKAVIEALESTDESIRQQTLDLLYRLLTTSNSENIIERLLFAFKNNSSYADNHNTNHADSQQRQQKLLNQLLTASERFGKSEEWYVDTILDLFSSPALSSSPSCNVLTIQSAEKVIQVFDQGPGNNHFNLNQLRIVAIDKCIGWLVQHEYNLIPANQSSSTSGPQHLLALSFFIFWILGSYADLLSLSPSITNSMSTVMDHLVCCLAAQDDLRIIDFIMTAITKIAIKMETASESVPDHILNAVRAELMQLQSSSSAPSLIGSSWLSLWPTMHQ